MILINHPPGGRGRHRCSLTRRLAALLLALVWTVALSVAASSLWADNRPSKGGSLAVPVTSLESGRGTFSAKTGFSQPGIGFTP